MPEELLQTKAEVIGAIATIFQVLFYVGILALLGCAVRVWNVIRKG